MILKNRKLKWLITCSLWLMISVKSIGQHAPVIGGLGIGNKDIVKVPKYLSNGEFIKQIICPYLLVYVPLLGMAIAVAYHSSKETKAIRASIFDNKQL